MSRDVYVRPIVERIAANPELGLCGLTTEAVDLLSKACQLLDMPADWLEGKCALHPDIVQSLALLLGDVLDAVQAEIDDPRRPLHVVGGGNA